MVICANGKCFGFVNTGQKGLEVNTTVGRKTDTFSISMEVLSVTLMW
jgi:hypothetical protein